MAEVEKKEEAVKPSASTPTSPIQTSKSGSPMKMIFGVGAALIVIGAAAVGGYFLLKNDSTDTEDTYSNKTKDTSVVKLETEAKDSIKSMLNAVDFEKLDTSNPSEMFDLEALAAMDTEGSLFKTKEIDVSGKTIYTAVEASMKVDAADTDPVDVSLNMDIYTQYPDDYSSTGMDSVENISAYFEDMTVDEFKGLVPNMYITGDFDVKTNDLTAKGKMDLYLIDFVMYAKFYDLDISNLSEEDQAGIAEFEGKVLSADLSDSLDSFFQQYLDMLSEYTSGYTADPLAMQQTVMEQLNASLEQAMAGMSEEDAAILKRVGPQIMDALDATVDDYKIFATVKSVDPIRSGSGSTCEEGKVDFVGILDTTKKGLLDIAKIVTSDSEYNGDLSYTDIADEMNTTFDDVKKSIKDANLKLLVNLCNDKSDDALTGAGIDFSFDDSEGSYAFDIQFLVVDYDSDKEISAPSVDMDLTDQVTSILDGMNLDGMMTGGSTLPIDMITDDLPVDDLTTPTDSGDDVFDSDTFDQYWAEYEALLEKWSNGEITEEEYYQGVEDLDKKYGYAE